MNNNVILLILLVLVVVGLIFFFSDRDQTPVPEGGNETTQSDEQQQQAPISANNNEIIGMMTAEAQAFAESQGVMFRVVEADGEPQPTTRDYREGRINATTENDIVVDFYIEGQEEEDVSETGMHDGIIGMSETEAQAYAEANNVPFRVGTVDGEVFPVTMDFVPGRITAEIADGVVISYTVE